MKRSHGHYNRINGQPRNMVVRLSEDELRAMTAEVRSHRRTDGTTREQRRKEYIKEREGL